MNFRLIAAFGLFFAPLVFSAQERIRICGSIVMEPGIVLAANEISVRINESLQSIAVDPTTKSYCLELGNESTGGDDSKNVYVTVTKTTSPQQTINSGYLWLQDPNGSHNPFLPAGRNLDFHLDAIYLGGSDPSDRKIFFPGIKSIELDFGAGANFVTFDTHSQSNKKFGQVYSNGNLVSDGSFEQEVFDWNVGPESVLPKQLAVKASNGIKAAVISIPVTSTVNLLTSKVFPMKPFQSYKLSFKYKRLSGTGDVRPKVLLLADNTLGSRQADASGANNYAMTGVWTSYEVVFTNSGYPYGSVSLLEHAGIAGGGVFEFDDVVLEESPGSIQSKVGQALAIYDGQNQMIQSLDFFGNTDIITQTNYDDFGRVSTKTLPIGYDYFRHNGRHVYLENLFGGPFGGHLNYYYGFPNPIQPDLSLDPASPGPNAKGYPYSEITYELSPFDRPSKVIASGGNWRGASSVSDRANRSFRGSISNGAVQLNDNAAAPFTTGINTLLNPDHFLSISQGENGEVSRTFTDKFDRVTRSEVKHGNSWFATTKEFDALGNVTAVYPPPGHDGQIIHTTAEFNSISEPVSEFSPDFGTKKYLYDSQGHLRLSQSQVQRDSRNFSYFKYDVLDRMTETGEYHSTSAFNQSSADNSNFPSLEDPDTHLKVKNYYDEVPSIVGSCEDPGKLSTVVISAPGSNSPGFEPDLVTAYNKSKARFGGQNSFSGDLRFLQGYSVEGEEFTPPPGMEFTAITLANGNQVGFTIEAIKVGTSEYVAATESPLPFNIHWGSLKGRLVKTLTCNQQLQGTPVGVKDIAKYFNYDKYGNATEIYEYNGYLTDAAKRWQKTISTYDVQNRVITLEQFPDAYSSSPQTHFSYVYDQMGRVDVVKDGSGNVVAKNNYNLIGQLSESLVGTAGPSQLHIKYQYRQRGWVNNIEARVQC